MVTNQKIRQKIKYISKKLSLPELGYINHIIANNCNKNCIIVNEINTKNL